MRDGGAHKSGDGCLWLAAIAFFYSKITVQAGRDPGDTMGFVGSISGSKMGTWHAKTAGRRS